MPQDSVYNLSEHPCGCSVMFKNRATHFLRFPDSSPPGFCLSLSLLSLSCSVFILLLRVGHCPDGRSGWLVLRIHRGWAKVVPSNLYWREQNASSLHLLLSNQPPLLSSEYLLTVLGSPGLSSIRCCPVVSFFHKNANSTKTDLVATGGVSLSVCI